MSTFICATRDERGIIREERVEAIDLHAAGEAVRQDGFSVVSVRKENEVLARIRTFLANRPPKYNDIIFSIRRMSMMLRNGIDLASTLRSLASQTSNETLRAVFDDVHAEVMGGETLSIALAKHSNVFPKMTIGLTQAGEESGRLGECLEEVARLGMRDLEIRSRVKGAFMYPVIVLAFALLIVVGFLLFVLPKFVEVFKSSGAELPVPTQILLLASRILATSWPLIIIGIGVGIYFLRKYYRTDSGQRRIDLFRLKMPLFGKLVLLSSLSRLSRTLGALLRSGIPIDRALMVAAGVSGNAALEYLLGKAREQIIRGGTLSDALGATGIMPELLLQMVGSGEMSGSLPSMLEEVGDFYDIETTHAIRNLVTILEPAMLVLMGVVVMAMALAVMLPLFKMSQMYR